MGDSGEERERKWDIEYRQHTSMNTVMDHIFKFMYTHRCFFIATHRIL